MEHHDGSSQGLLPLTHEYPDPDYAAYVTRYPWVGEEDDYVPPALQPRTEVPWNSNFGSNDAGSGSSDHHEESSHSLNYFPGLDSGLILDPDYELSDTGRTDDENVSDDDSDFLPFDPVEASKGTNNALGSKYGQSPGHAPNIRSRKSSDRGRGRGRRGRRGDLGRANRGGKRGLRKPLEPTPEFKALHSQATLAFINRNYDEAEHLTLGALLINPEIYSAHNLLSEIHAARGDMDKALSAAWTGAHTRPRDKEVWSRLAQQFLELDGHDRTTVLRLAIYCYSRILYVDSSNVEARYQRAALRRELGSEKTAAQEYEYLIRQLPHDTTVLRHLAEIYIELNEPDRALRHYQDSLSHFQSKEPVEVTSFTWSDVNIVAELYGFQQHYDEGISELKSLSRWLLGRGADACWEAFSQDDREWDVEDQPRRVEVLGFVAGEYDQKSYGDGLPLELRIKLGLFRLNLEPSDFEEAVNHFEWLDPEDNQSGAKLYDYPDLFQAVADALRKKSHNHEALRYYKPLQQVNECMSDSNLLGMASCYKSIGLMAEAEDCYKTIMDRDRERVEAGVQPAGEAWMHLAGMCEVSSQSPTEVINADEVVSVSKRKARIRVGRDMKQPQKTTVSPSLMTTLLAPRLGPPQKAKHLALEEKQGLEESIRMLFLHRQAFTEKARDGDQSSKAEWTKATKTLIEGFAKNKFFYPLDKHHKFYGYSNEARIMAAKPKYELDALAGNPDSSLEKLGRDQIKVPDDYCGIPFHTWLDIFLEYGLTLAQSGDFKSAYGVIARAFHANVFYHSPNSLFLIHVCWFTCALVANDDEILCNIARWFMKEYQFVSDSYRLFAALNRLCDSDNSWYNCGPSQKYLLRQLKAVDFSLLGEARRKSLFQERPSYTTKDSNGNPIQAKEMDVALLILYGHVLYAGKSYAFALNYYLRAFALDSNNPMIKLSVALGYLHYALKRQADNRQQILMQGFAFLLDYYESRQQSHNCIEKQEAEFNVARAYHLLGLTHLAIPYYERCLKLSTTLPTENLSRDTEDFAREAAFALQGLWAASGNVEMAREVTEKWLVIW